MKKASVSENFIYSDESIHYTATHEYTSLIKPEVQPCRHTSLEMY